MCNPGNYTHNLCVIPHPPLVELHEHVINHESPPPHAHSISSNLVELLAVDCTDEEAVRELRVLVHPTVEWVKASHTSRSGRQNVTSGGTGTVTGMYGNIVDNMKHTGGGPTSNGYSKNYKYKNSNDNDNRNGYGKPSTNYGNNKTVSYAVSSTPSSTTAGGASGLGVDSGLSLGKQGTLEY